MLPPPPPTTSFSPTVAKRQSSEAWKKDPRRNIPKVNSDVVGRAKRSAESPRSERPRASSWHWTRADATVQHRVSARSCVVKANRLARSCYLKAEVFQSEKCMTNLGMLSGEYFQWPPGVEIADISRFTGLDPAMMQVPSGVPSSRSFFYDAVTLRVRRPEARRALAPPKYLTTFEAQSPPLLHVFSHPLHSATTRERLAFYRQCDLDQ